MNTYEIMFLFDPTFGSNWDAVQAEIGRLMDRAQAEIILTKRLEERRLAFEIHGRKRGLYVLTYFRAPGGNITALERDVRLAEHVLRVLILRAEGVSEEHMKAATLGGVAQEPRQPAASPEQADGAEPSSSEAAPAAEAPAGDQPELVGSPTPGTDDPQAES